MDHAREMGGPVPEEPMFFFKPENAKPGTPGEFPIPEFSDEPQFEVELAVLIEREGRNIKEGKAKKYFSEISLGIDFTARDLQRRQKQLGFPWEVCKSFEDSAPVGKWISLIDLPKEIQELQFSLTVNGEVRQLGNTADMIFPVSRLIAFVSKYVTLNEGDILLTGTPEGVGTVKHGDRLVGKLEGETLLEVTVV